MKRYDCVVLYNPVNVSTAYYLDEKLYPANIFRDEVTAVTESLREGGYHPYVLAVERFSGDLVQALSEIAPKFVFNLCEEINGNCKLEMCVAGLLEMMDIPYTGSPPLALGLALDKFRVKHLLQAGGIPTAKGYLVPLGQQPSGIDDLRFPLMVKPCHEDASLGINSQSVCYDEEQLRKQIRYIHDFYRQEALVEEFLDGREFNVSVIGEQNPEVLAVSEIDFSGMPEGEPRIVSYRAKWDEESPMYNFTVPVCPAKITKHLEHRIRDIALRSYKCVGCRDYARIDMRTDSRGNVKVLEVNPNPDISPKAGFARAARAAGYSYSDIILRICEAAIKRGTKRAAAIYAT